MSKSLHPCHFCGLGRFSILYRNLPSMYSNFSSNIEQCSNCGHGLTNPSPGSDTVKDIYLNTYSIPSQKLIRREKRRNSRLLVRWMQPIIRPNKVLEVGCMFGDLLAVLEESSISASGIELDEFATITACNEGREVLAGNFEILLSENFDTAADTIVLVHCLEHFSDPQNVLSTLFRNYPNVLYILIVVPNFDSQLRRVLGKYWGSFQVGTHYHHFTPNSLKAVLTSTGWSVKAQKFAGPDSIFFGATFINFLMRFNVRVDLNKPQQFFSFPMKILGYILSKLKRFGNEEIWCIARRPINPTAQHH